MKKNPISTIAIVFVVFFIVGIVFVVQGNTDKKITSKEAIKYEDLTALNIEKNAHVDGEIWACLGPYAEEYQTRYFIKSSDSTYYYLIPTSDGFISISTSDKTLIAKLNNLKNATYDYITGETDNIYCTPIEFEGKIIKLNSEIEGYMYEWLYSSGLYDQTTTKDELKTICNSKYNVVALGNAYSGLAVGYGMTAIGGIGAIAFLLIFLKSRKKNQSVYPNGDVNFPTTPNYTPDGSTSYNPPSYTTPTTNTYATPDNPTPNVSNVDENGAPTMAGISLKDVVEEYKRENNINE